MNTDANIVESSTTPAPVAEPAEAAKPVESTPEAKAEKMTLEELSPKQYEKWKETGEIPVRSKQAEATNAPAEPAKAADQPSDSATGKPKGKGADLRVKELLQERYQDRQKIQELEAKLNPGQQSDPKASTEAPGAPVEPLEENFPDYPTYRAAERKYIKDLAKFELREEFRQAEVERSNKDQAAKNTEAWESKVEAYKKVAPDFDVAKAAEEIPGIDVLKDYLVHPKFNGPALAHHLQNNPDLASELAASEPVEIVRQLALLERELEQGAKAPKTATPVLPPGKPVSKAAPPAREPSGNAAPVDALQEAIRTKNFEEYQKLMNQRDRRSA